MTYKTLQLTSVGSVWTLTVNRPDALNALNAIVLEEMLHALQSLKSKPYSEAKVLVVTGAGEKAFVAGADIKEMSSLSAAQAEAFSRRGQDLLRELEQLSIPVLAAVNGFALGGGLELALACDFIFASDNAKFGLPEVTLGLIPGFGGTVRLARAIGLPRAKELIFSGNMVGAEEAKAIGLVNRVCSRADLLATVNKIAETISQRGPIAVAHSKRSIMQAYDLDIDAAMIYEASQFGQLFQTHDTKEGTQAFIEKRPAKFTGE